jgi:NADH:ubiquinone reductase (non-electrogenic)
MPPTTRHPRAGVGPTPFTLSLPFAKTRLGRIAVDEYLRVMAPAVLDAAGHARVGGRRRAACCGLREGRRRAGALVQRRGTRPAPENPPCVRPAPQGEGEAEPAPEGITPLTSEQDPPPAPASGQQQPGPLRPLHDVYALGDCCANSDNPLPALAQASGLACPFGAVVFIGRAGSRPCCRARRLVAGVWRPALPCHHGP